MKSVFKYSFLVALGFLCIFVNSCEVGLGEAVDTQPPVVSVLAPEADSVIKETFIMSGTCSDEQGLASVEVTLRNTSTNKTYPIGSESDSKDKTFKAKIDNENDTWTCEINPLDENAIVPDGSYEATVVAFDKAGRRTRTTKSFVIDNTPPLLVLTRPSTKLDAESVDTYGQEFSISGQVADDNSVEKLVVTVYDENGIKLRDIELNNVPPTIDLSVAKFGDANYTEIYGTEIGDTKKYSCSIEIFDSARHCPPLSDEEEHGNSTKTYYLYKDIYSSVLSKYKVTEVYHMLNGTYEDSASSSAARTAVTDTSKAVEDVLQTLNDEKIKTENGSFSLNPANNPTYVLTGYSKLSKGTATEKQAVLTGGDYGLLSSSSISVKLSAGLDKAPLVKESLGLYLKPLIKNSDETYSISTDDSDIVWLLKKGEAQLQTDGKTVGDLSEVGSYDFSFSVAITAGSASLKTGVAYILYAEGKDENDITFVNYEDQGFYLESSGSAPRLTVTEPAVSTVYLSKDGVFDLKGKLSSEEKVALTVKLIDNEIDNINDAAVVAKYEVKSWDESINDESWEYSIPFAQEEINQNKSKDYTISVIATAGSRNVEKQFTVGYDVDGPEIDIASILPKVTTYKADGTTVEREDNVNGSVTAKVRISDSYYKIAVAGQDSTNPDYHKTIIQFYDGEIPIGTPYTGFESNITHVFDTTTFGIDNKEVTMKVTAYDYAGNKSETTETLYINQETDKPIVKLGEGFLTEGYESSYPDNATGNLLIAGSAITVTVSDDDGIDNIIAIIKDSDGQTVSTLNLTSSKITSNPYPLSVTIPNTVGIYNVEIIATDTEKGTTNKTCKFYFMVDSGNPSIAISESENGQYYGKKSGPIEVNGTVTGIGGLKIYRDYANKVEIDADGDGVADQPAATKQQSSWKDLFKVASDAEETGSVTHATYTVKDSKGRTTTATFSYFIDNTAPTVSIINEDTLISSSNYKFQGTASDSGTTVSGVSSVYYKIISGDYSSSVTAPDSEVDAKNDSTWKKLNGTASWNFFQTFAENPSSSELAEGKYTLYVTAYDVAQNGSELKHLTFTADLTPPTVTTSYTPEGSSAVDITSTSSTQLNKKFTYNFTVADTLGLATTPYVLTVKKDGSVLTKTTDYTETFNASTGIGSVTFANQEDGSYSFELVATDSVGKTTTVVNELILDTAAPKIEFTSPASEEWNTTASVTIRGSAEDSNTVTGVYYIKSDSVPTVPTNGSWTGWTKATGTASWRFTPDNVSQGTTKYYVAAVDSFNNYTTAKEFILNVDSEVPVIQNSKFKQNSTEETIVTAQTFKKNTSLGFTLSGTVTDSVKLSTIKITGSKDGADSVEIYSLDVPEANKKSCAWEKTFVTGNTTAATGQYKLADGTWTLTLTVKDGSENTATKNFTLVIDTTAPELTITSNESVLTTAENTFAGTADDSIGDVNSGIEKVYYKLLSSTATAPTSYDNTWSEVSSGTANWKITKTLYAEGSYKLYVIAKDKASNFSEVKSYSFTADLYAPTVKTYTKVGSSAEIERTTTTSAISMNAQNADYSFLFEVSDTLALDETAPYTLTVSLDGTEITKETDYTVTESSGKYTVKINNEENSTEQKNGTYTYKVVAKDKVGKTTTVTNTVLLDTKAPTLNITSPEEDAWQSKNTVTIRGESEDESGIGKVYYIQQSNEPTVNGNWTGWTELTGKNTWNFTTPSTTSEGETNYYFAAVDTLGNYSTKVTPFTLKVDSANPVISNYKYKKGSSSLADFKSDIITNETVTLSATISDTHKLKALTLVAVNKDENIADVTLDSKTYSTSSDEKTVNWSKEITTSQLTDGEWILTLSVTDGADKTTELSYGVTVDTKAPKITATTPITYSNASVSAKTGGDYYSDSKPNLSVNVEDSGKVSVYCLTSAEKYSTDDELSSAQSIDTSMNQSGTTNTYTKQLSVSDGTTYVYIMAKDEAGNTSYYGASTGSIVIKSDKTAPEVTFVSPDNSTLLSKNNARSFEISVADDYAGVNGTTAKVKLGNTEIGGYTVTDGKITGTITQAQLSAVQGDSVTLAAVVSDLAGNSKTANLPLNFDSTAPTVKITNPVGDKVNGKISISGTATDNVGLQSVTLYRTALTGETGITVPNISGSVVLMKEFDTEHAYSWTYSDENDSELLFDVSSYDGVSITFYVVAIDTAENVNVATKSVTVDQDGDRPIIKFTNIVLTDSMSDSDRIWITKEQIYGTVTDDDGAVQSVKISFDNGNSWTEVYSVSDANWSFDFENDGTADGSKNIYFKVKDAEGTEFTSSISNTIDLKAPKLNYKEVTYGSSANMYSTVLYSKVDLTSPTIPTAYYSTDDYSSVTNSTIKDLFNSNDKPNDTSSWNSLTSITEAFGGNVSKFYVLVKAKDANGIKAIETTFGGSAVTLIASASVDAAENMVALYKVDVSSYSNMEQKPTLFVKATDKANSSSSLSYEISIDNKAPVISILSPKDGAILYGTYSQTVTGQASDTNDVKEFWVGVSKDSQTEPTEYENIAATSATQVWNLVFSGNTSETSEQGYHLKTFNEWINSLYGSGYTETVTNASLCIWLYGVDKLGNSGKSSPVKLSVNVLTQGDKPSVSVTYPKENTTLGGGFIITGSTTIATGEVDAVYVQIDPSYDGTFNEDWAEEIQDIIDNNGIDAYSISTPEDDKVKETISSGIKAEGSAQSWSLPVNSKSEFNSTDGSNVNMAIRVYAVSSTKKVSEPVIIPFTLDPGSPIIGEQIAITLVQYEDNENGTGNVTSTQLYESNMWIKGKWWLIGSVSDETGLEYVNLNGTKLPTISGTVTESSSTASGSGIVVNTEKTPANSSYNNYILHIPVGIAESDMYGKLSYSISAKENEGTKDTSLLVDLQYDNKAPEFASTTLKTNEINSIVQSDGVYEIKGTLKDVGSGSLNQSGFKRIAFYITRNYKDSDYITDFMKQQGSAITDNSVLLSELNKSDDLYWNSVAGCKVQNYNEIIVPETLPWYVRKGGLCRINNVIYLIKSVSNTIVTIDTRIANTKDDNTITADFAFAQVIDNTVTEVGKTTFFEDNTNTITNDDGDFMVESYSETSGEWKVSINSKNILDGAVQLHFVAYDQAGNYTVQSYNGTVANNAPRIAGVKFGTDRNGDNVVQDDEYVKSYSGLYAVDGANHRGNITVNGQSSAGTKISKLAIPYVGDDTSSISGNSVMTIKGKTVIVPEIVGGNEGLGYTYKVDKSETTIKQLNTIHSGTDDIRDVNTTTIELGIVDILQQTESDGDKVFDFKIWDYTEGMTAGTDSNYAELLIKMNVALRDSEAPTAGIKPFYWNSDKDGENSIVYENNVLQGHIELESDLPEDIFKSNSTDKLYDLDPKVSGKIYLEGFAKDNVLVNEIKFKFSTLGGFANDYKTIATRVNGEWPTTPKLIEDGVTLIYLKESLDENTEYDVVEWKLSIDTAKIANVASTEIKAEIQAIDRGSASISGDSYVYSNGKTSASSSTQTTSATNTPYYKMDVVPYVTKIQTANRTKSGLKDNNIRSASGKYSIMYASGTTASTYAADFITISGFNLNPGANDIRVVDSTTAKTASVTATSGIKATRSAAASSGYTSVSISNVLTKSGYLEVFTNGVRTLNNINSDDAKGSYTGSAISDWANYYNREPDYYTTKNVQLTDDRYLLLFDMHTAQTPSGSNSWKDLKNAYYPVMLMNGDNPVFGYMNGSGGPNVDAGTGRGTGAGKYYPSHAMPQRAEFNGTSGAEVYTEYLIKASAWDGMGMAVDEGGRYYNVSSYNRDGAAMSLIYDRYAELYTNGQGWGAGTTYQNYGGDKSNATTNNAITLDSMNYGSGVLLGRYMYPKLIANGNSKTGTAKVYMAYYDDGTGGIAFRNFQLGTSVSGTAVELDNTNGHTDKDGTRYAQKINFNENTSYDSAEGEGRLTAVASGSKYYDMGVTSDNHVVIIYYDEDASCLKLVYSTNAVDGSSPTATVAWTSSSVTFPSYAGTYCSMAIDASGRIHIAAFDASNADLKYFYLPSYSSTSLTTCMVDSAGSVGHWTGIAICTNSENTELNGKPVISYYNSTETGTRESIKLAYPKAAIGSIEAGVDANGYTTGNWDYMTVPAITPPQGGDSKFQKVCLGFDTKGIPVIGYCGTNLEFGKQLSE